MDKITELFEQPTISFDHHLNLPNNHRILFSGQFGIGKTTFIKHYFDNRKDQFNVIHLFPVNYSILDNHDIFSYLKYDIFLSLFASNAYQKEEDFYLSFDIWDDFIFQNPNDIIATTALLIPKLGKQLNQFTKDLGKLFKKFKEAQKSSRDKDLEDLNKLISEKQNKEGGIYESNLLTRILQDWLRAIKEKGLQNVLIIDDLDRIDPQHIFRLLNVFSAHFDNQAHGGAYNKFGFEKVIFVCDSR